MPLDLIDTRTQGGHDVHQRRHQSTQPEVLTGSEFRRLLKWGKDRFYTAVKAGRFRHLIAVNASSESRTVYVKVEVERWVRETPPSALRARQSQSR